MEKVIKIMHCPFCKSKISITYNDFEKAGFAYHEDENCFFDSDPIRIDGCDNYEEAVAKWNKQVEQTNV